MGPLEHRAALEFRAVGRRLEGVAVPFDQITHIGGFDEVVRSGAFTESLADGHDILGLVDHDPTRLLGRTRNGTLRLQEARQGLLFEIDVAGDRGGTPAWAATCS